MKLPALWERGRSPRRSPARDHSSADKLIGHVSGMPPPMRLFTSPRFPPPRLDLISARRAPQIKSLVDAHALQLTLFDKQILVEIIGRYGGLQIQP